MSPTIQTRKLGKNGPSIPALGLGLMGISSFYGKTESDEERFKVLDRAYELGETFWDSADIYGDSEDLIGKWYVHILLIPVIVISDLINVDEIGNRFAKTGKRNDIFLATKFANRVVGSGENMRREINSSPEYCKDACEKSLKRLGVETIDLYYCHRVDGKTPIEKTVEAMAELKK